MKAGTLMYATIVIGVLLLQDTANSDKSVSKEKIRKWGSRSNALNKEEIKIGEVDMKNNPELAEQGKEMQNLIQVIQYVVSNSLNSEEFRLFMIKRFLQNYLSQADGCLKKIKKLKKKMNPKSTLEDDRKLEALKNLT